MRQQLRRLQKKAAARGIREADTFFDRTPREIGLLLESHGARARARLQQAHMQACLTALAVHAPRQLPPFPAFEPEEEMDWQEMKQRLLAGRRKDVP